MHIFPILDDQNNPEKGRQLNCPLRSIIVDIKKTEKIEIRKYTYFGSRILWISRIFASRTLVL